MTTEFYAERTPRRFGAGILALAALMIVACIVSAFMFREALASSFVPFPAILMCVAPPLMIMVWWSIRLVRCNSSQRWEVSGGVASYHSPSPALGQSFRASLSEIVAVSNDGDSDFARCVLSSGQTHVFHLGCEEGMRFLWFLQSQLEAEPAA